MTISIIIINYNTFELTLRSIQSIIEKTRDVDYEIILVDNASTECPADKFKEVFPNIQLIKSPTNVGFAKGNNLGIGQAKGEFILLLNSDTELLNNAIKIGLDSFKEIDGIGVLTCKLLLPNGKIQHVCQRFPSIKSELIELSRFYLLCSQKKRGELMLNNYFSHEYLVTVDWVWATFFMFPKKILDALPNKKLPETFFMYYEDLEWCNEIKKLGYKIIYNPEAQIIHFSGSSTNSAEQQQIKNIQQLHNEFNFISSNKNAIYTRFYYFIRGIKHLSFFYYKSNLHFAWVYLKMIFHVVN